MNFEESRIIPVDIEKEMKKSYLDYSMSVIVGRALPDVRDGLKPVHRRIIYTMYENNLMPNKSYRKCADTVGTVLGRYHPHGDASVYDALVRMAQDFSLRYPLVDGQGNFGSVDGDPAAAYRYTEAKMSKISTNLITNIEKETVDFVNNYDDRLQEPSVLPSRFPNILINGATGIAVGMATNIPPHNLCEVIDGIIYLMDNENAEPIDLMEYIKAPDFPTGGIIMGHSGIRAAYTTGRGKITLRGRTEIEVDKNGKSSIIITEIPYMVNKARLITNFAELVKEKRIEGITNLRDESDRDGMRIVIEIRKDANPQIILNQLYKYSQLQETVGVIMLALCNGQPKVLNLKQILQHYIEFQISIIKRRTEFDLKKAKERCHILEGLKIALDFIDEVIKILRASKTITEGKTKLIKRFKLSDIQSTAIVQMRFGQLTGLEKIKIEEELNEILQKISEYEFILANHFKVIEIIKTELLEIKEKFGDERRTGIEIVTGEVDIEDLIKEEECVVTITHFGYIKRLPIDTYKSQKRGGRGVTGVNNKDEDFVEELFTSSTHDYVLFMTNKGKVYRKKCYQIPEGSRTARGMNIKNILPLEENEKVTYMLNTREFKDDNYLIMLTVNGIIKRTPLSAYDTSRKNGIIAINLDENDELAWVHLSSGNDDIIIATRNGVAIKINENDARPLGRTARGVKAINLKENDKVVGLAPVLEGYNLLTITENGQGRRTKFSDYRLQNRAGKGIINYKDTKENGLIASVMSVKNDDDIILITNDGIIIRTNVESISLQSRYAKGVKVMRVKDQQKIVNVVATEKYIEETEILENNNENNIENDIENENNIENTDNE